MRLRNRQAGYKFRRQYSFGNYVVDFYYPETRLAVEVDGLSHEGKMQYDHVQRQKFIESLGVKVMRFTSEEIFKSIDRVIENIYSVCEARKPPQPLLIKEGT